MESKHLWKQISTSNCNNIYNLYASNNSQSQEHEKHVSKSITPIGLGQGYCRSEGFPNGIFHPCALWARALARWENCRRAAVAVGVIWKFRSTFRPGNYIWSFSYGFGVVVRDIWEWRPGFYTEFRYKSREHSGLAWGAILRKVFVLTLIPRLPCSFFQEQAPRSLAPRAARPPPVFPGYEKIEKSNFQYFQDMRK